MESDATWLRKAATWIAGASIVLVVVNAALVLRNQDTQRVVNQRQAVINQAVQVSRVQQLLVDTIARAAITRKDDTLVALLERHGYRINMAPGAPAAAAGNTP